MTDRSAITDPNETPEDVATLYSWANLHGAKYRDFSAARAQTRERQRQRVQAVLEAERRDSDKSGSDPSAGVMKQGQGQVRSEEAVQGVGPEIAERAFPPAQSTSAGIPVPAATPYTPQPAPAYPLQPWSPARPPRDERGVQDRWAPAELRETGPAWLSSDNHQFAAPVPHAPEDTLQASRDRLTSRWFALKGLFAGNGAPQTEPAPAAGPSRAPVLAVFSLAGGVGKTSLVATLGRALSARGERVLLVDTASYGLLPFFFGATDQRPGILRTFTAPGNGGDAPVQLLSVDCENLGPDSGAQEQLSQDLSRYGTGVSRILIDLATASASITRRVARIKPAILVPIIPDLSSLVSVGSIETFFQRNSGGAAHPVQPYYLLNQFDPSLPLHLDVREVLREQLGERLLPFSLRRSPAVSEALAEGMTVVDYAPNSAPTEDFNALATWVKSFAAPASTTFRGVRWSER